MMKIWKPSEAEIAQTETWETWGKEESEFPWTYDNRETCLILEGAAEVSDNTGNKISFEAGDMVQFESGLSCNWKITKEIKKRYRFG